MTATASYSSEPEYLPPDDGLIALARKINARLDHGRVDFYVAQHAGSTSPRYAIIFQAGPKRVSVDLRARPSEHDIDDIISGLSAWAGRRSGQLYSTKLPDEGGDYV